MALRERDVLFLVIAACASQAVSKSVFECTLFDTPVACASLPVRFGLSGIMTKSPFCVAFNSNAVQFVTKALNFRTIVLSFVTKPQV
jgi:hypothetical protein